MVSTVLIVGRKRLEPIRYQEVSEPVGNRRPLPAAYNTLNNAGNAMKNWIKYPGVRRAICYFTKIGKTPATLTNNIEVYSQELWRRVYSKNVVTVLNMERRSIFER